uniref:protein-serine/threonine phosphatase n=1 Tax=Aegilops tauschii subsp. strangulata TaxID=200361 RepID=A0A453AXP2_AEGTS
MDPLFRRAGPINALKSPSLSIEPQVHVRKLKPRNPCLIFVSDGVWEHLSDDAAVQIIFKNQRNGRV